jgi:phage terminase large subunit GpA-like protein
MVTRIVKGYPKRIRQKTRDRNEALDCRVYARAAAIALGLDHRSENKWEQLASQSAAEKKWIYDTKKSIPVSSAVAPKSTTRPRVVRSSIM